MPRLKIVSIFLFLSIALFACRPEEYTPKPRGFARIDTPAKHSYTLFDQSGFPYSFEYPTYASISRDTQFFMEKKENPYWININFSGMGGVIYLSYTPVQGRASFLKLLEDAHFMSFYHTKRADYQNDFSFKNEYGVQGYLYEWGGNAASRYQFVATDSLHHFIRGALYFNCTPNADSLKPLNDFVKTDIQQILKTIRWK